MSTKTDPVRSFTKTVAIKATDDEERTATGVVLTPLELDHQLDYFRAAGIQAMFNPEPADGVMHAAFPEDAAGLEFNRVLEEPTEIDGITFDAGEWVVRRKYDDEELWGLVQDGILAAFSIGGDVTEEIQFDSIEDLPDDVTIPGEVDPESVPEKYWPPAEVTNGFVSEISDVDIPAVPRATHAVVKALGGVGVLKNIVEEVDGEAEFLEVMVDRGHTEDDAERLWSFLTEHVEADGSKTASRPVGKPFAGFDDFAECVSTMQADGHDQESAEAICGALQDEAENTKHDMTGPDPDGDEPTDTLEDVDDATLGKRLKRLLFGDVDGGGDGEDGHTPPALTPATKALAVSQTATTLKEGRPLNASNREALMAAHDAIESALASDVDFESNRFTDNDNVEFSIEDFGKLDDGTREKLLKAVTPEQAEMVAEALAEFVSVHGETADVRSFEGWMIEHDFAGELEPDQLVALNVSLQDFFQEREFAGEAVIDEFRTWLGRQTNTPDLIEMSKNESDGTEKENSGSDDGTDTPDEPPEWAKALQEQAERNKERLDEIFGEAEEDVEKVMEEQAPEWAKAIYEKAQSNAERIEQIGKQGGATTQLGGGADVEGEGAGAEPERKFDKAWDETFRVAPRTDGGERR